MYMYSTGTAAVQKNSDIDCRGYVKMIRYTKQQVSLLLKNTEDKN